MAERSLDIDPRDGDVFDGVGIAMLEGAMSYYVRLLNLHLARFLERELEGTPLARGTGKATTLVMAAARHGVTAAEIAPFACKDAPAMTRLVDRLVSDGLLRREPDPTSGRRQLLFATEAGRAMVERLRRITALERTEVFGMMSEDDHRRTLAALRRVLAVHVGAGADPRAAG